MLAGADCRPERFLRARGCRRIRRPFNDPLALPLGEGHENSVRGVNLMHVRDGKIVEALGYVKAGLRP
jgi:hypothetical protein